ncbi:MAG: lytic transglycosylase domain-containing protein [Pyrinomonadaceae bacterium]
MIIFFASFHPESFAQQSVMTRAQFSKFSLFDRAKFFEGAISRIALEEQVDPHLLWTIAYNETRFRPWLRSYAGAEGLMQFIPATAARFNLVNPYQPEPAIRAAARYVRFLSNRFGGRIDSILAGYNAGEGAVDAYLQGKTVRAGKKIINPSGIRTVGGVPPYRETIGYVAQGLIVYRQLRLRQMFSGSFVLALYPPNFSEAVARVRLQDNEFGFAGTVLTQVPNPNFLNATRGAQNQFPQFQTVSQTVQTNVSPVKKSRQSNENLQTDYVLNAAETTLNNSADNNSNEKNSIQNLEEIYYEPRTGTRYKTVGGNLERLAESGELVVGNAVRTPQPTSIRARGTFFGGKKNSSK